MTCSRPRIHAPPSRSTISSSCSLNIGWLAAALGGLEAFIFTAGIGEHAAELRARIVQRAAWLGAELAPAANAANASLISAPGSRIGIHVIPTNEELMIAGHTLRLITATH